MLPPAEVLLGRLGAVAVVVVEVAQRGADASRLSKTRWYTSKLSVWSNSEFGTHPPSTHKGVRIRLLLIDLSLGCCFLLPSRCGEEALVSGSQRTQGLAQLVNPMPDIRDL